MNHIVLRESLRYLSLEQKSKVMSVCTQFYDCVNDLLKIQKKLYIRFSSHENGLNQLKLLTRSQLISEKAETISEYSQINTNGENVSENSLDMNDMRRKFEPLLKKLQNLKVIQMCLLTVTEDFCQWISEVFPQIGKIKIVIKCRKEWKRSELEIVKNYFGPKLTELLIWNFKDSNGLTGSQILETPTLRDISLHYCKSVEDYQQIFSNLPKNLDLLICINCFGLNSEGINALSAESGKKLKLLSIDFVIDIQSEYLESICRNCLHLECLLFRCVPSLSLKPIEKLKSLQTLLINVTEKSLFSLSSIKNSNLTTLEIVGFFQLKPNAIENFQTYLPRVTSISFKGLTIICCCGEHSPHCINCHKQFFRFSSKAIQKSLNLKSFLLLFANIPEESQMNTRMIMKSLLEEYLDSGNSYELNIKTKESESCLLDFILLCHIKLDRIITFIIDSNIFENINSKREIFPKNVIVLEAEQSRDICQTKDVIEIKQKNVGNHAFKWFTVELKGREKSIKKIDLLMRL